MDYVHSIWRMRVSLLANSRVHAPALKSSWKGKLGSDFHENLIHLFPFQKTVALFHFSSSDLARLRGQLMAREFHLLLLLRVARNRLPDQMGFVHSHKFCLRANAAAKKPGTSNWRPLDPLLLKTEVPHSFWPAS